MNREKLKELSLPDSAKSVMLSHLKYHETKQMFCPLCDNKLVFKEWMVVYGVMGDEDRCKYECVNNECELFEKSFWDDNGDYYTGKLDFDKTRKLFPDDKYSAKNSFSCKSDIEIYKKGLKNDTYLPAFLCLWFLKPYIEHCYKADDWGNIKKRFYKLKFLKKGDRGGYTTHYTSDVTMFIFLCKQYIYKKKLYLNNPSQNKNDLIKLFLFEAHTGNEWWRILFIFIINIFQYRTYKKLLYVEPQLSTKELRKKKLLEIKKSQNFFVSLYRTIRNKK